jgi:integrase
MAFYDFLSENDQNNGPQETVTLLDAWRMYLESRAVAPKTLSEYMRWGHRMATRWPAIDRHCFADCVQTASASLTRQGYSATTVHGFQCAMASMAAACWKWDAGRRRAMITAKPVKPVHSVPDVHQIRALCAAMPAKYATLALLCYCGGLRISEAISLTLGDVDLVNLRINIRVTKCSKGRNIPIPPEFISDLRKHAALAMDICRKDLARGDIFAPVSASEWTHRRSNSQEPALWPFFPQGSICINRWGSGYVRPHVHPSKVERIFQEARKGAGITSHITPHRLRDAYAVHSLLAGVPINVIQAHMGHATLETTAKYLSFLLTPEGARSFPGLNLFKGLQEATTQQETA